MTQSAVVEPETEDPPLLLFPEGLPGFPEAHNFLLVQMDEMGLVYDLRSDDEALQLVVVPSAVFVPDYAPEIDDDAVALLQLEGAEDALVLLVVTVGETLAESTINLRAPIVINARNSRASQVLLADENHAIQSPLPAPALG